MNAPLVSVKMITFNHAPFIAQAIEGVLNQDTSFPFELVIGEDCSADGTGEIVHHYQKKYPDIIRIVTSDQNVGMKKNSYRTTKACKGTYIAFCEGDDYWHHPGKIQKQVDYFEINPNCGMVYTNYDVYHPKSRRRINDFIKYRNWHIPEHWDVESFVGGGVGSGRGILTCTVMARLSLVNMIIDADPYLHQNPKFLMGDTQLWAEIISQSRVHYIPESLATHIITDESATRSKDVKKVVLFNISNAELMLALCEKYNLSSTIRNKHLNYWCDSALRLSFHTQDKKLADEVREIKKIFNIKEWCRFYGAQNRLVHCAFKMFTSIINLFREKFIQWI
ncbi:MAG: glycosyltransferase [Deltaproteobacteria bacterium]|nr:glycosyltransferase [Deltaproteobacteria bacterium]